MLHGCFDVWGSEFVYSSKESREGYYAFEMVFLRGADGEVEDFDEAVMRVCCGGGREKRGVISGLYGVWCCWARKIQVEKNVY